MPEVSGYIGGSFAPPLTDESMAAYKSLIDAQPPSAVKDAMATLHNCCGVWWNLPESNGTATQKHPVGVGLIVKLHDDHAKALEPNIPWDHELDAIQALFETIPNETQKPLRDAAFHLLWHVKELSLGREPLTNDKL